MARGCFPLELIVVLVIDVSWIMLCKFGLESLSDSEAMSGQDFFDYFWEFGQTHFLKSLKCFNWPSIAGRCLFGGCRFGGFLSG